MNTNQVPVILPKTLIELTSQSSNFHSNQISIDANNQYVISLHVSSSSALEAFAKIQGSQDGSTWFDLNNTETFIKSDDDIFWLLTDIRPVMFIRLDVNIITGSALFMAVSRGS